MGDFVLQPLAQPGLGEGAVDDAAHAGAGDQPGHRRVLQFVQGHVGARGEAVAGRGDQRQRFLVQQQALRGQDDMRADPDQGHVQPAFAQVQQQRIAHAGAQVHVHRAVRLAEAAQQGRQLHRVERGDLADVQAPAHRAQGLRHLLVQAFGRTQRGAGVVQEHLAGGGRPYLPRAALEQARAQRFLDLGDLVAQRRLHRVAAPRGGGEAAFLGHSDREFELAQGQHGI